MSSKKLFGFLPCAPAGPGRLLPMPGACRMQSAARPQQDNHIGFTVMPSAAGLFGDFRPAVPWPAMTKARHGRISVRPCSSEQPAQLRPCRLFARVKTEPNLGAHRPCVVDFHLRCIRRHDDDRPHAMRLSSQSHALARDCRWKRAMTRAPGLQDPFPDTADHPPRNLKLPVCCRHPALIRRAGPADLIEKRESEQRRAPDMPCSRA